MRPLRSGNFEVVISGDQVTLTTHAASGAYDYVSTFDAEELNDLEYVVQQASGQWRRTNQRRD